MREPDYGSANRENGSGVSILMAGMTVFSSAVQDTGLVWMLWLKKIG